MGVGTRSGRPPKFNELRRPVTMTLPERTIRQLAEIDQDRARAVVRLADGSVGGATKSTPAVELVEFMPGQSLIVVSSSKTLRMIPWLRMVKVAADRFLLVIPSGTSAETLEVAIHDAMEDLAEAEHGEAELLKQLWNIMRHHRRRAAVSKAELLVVAT